LVKIADQLRQRGWGDEPLVTGRTRNFLGIEEAALAVAFDLALGARDAGVSEPVANLGDGQGVMLLVVVLVRPAEAGRVIHLGSVPSERAAFRVYPLGARPWSNEGSDRGYREDSLERWEGKYLI
jgi:hypothetical protein